MASATLKRPISEEKSLQSGPKRKKSKRRTQYHSSSSESEADVDIGEVENEQLPREEGESKEGESKEGESKEGESREGESEEDQFEEDQFEGGESEVDEIIDSSMESEEDQEADSKTRKRNDTSVFATSMSKILGSKLSTSKRADPVLSRSKEASDAVKELNDSRLEAKAKQKLREEKKAKLDTGRVKDVLGLESVQISTQEIMEHEKRLKKIAQRGVIKLFNAVRVAQVKGEEAAREAKKTGVVGMDKREERVNEMSKRGFLDLIAGGGKR